MSCRYNKDVVMLNTESDKSDKSDKSKKKGADKGTDLSASMRVGTYMSDADTEFPDENNEGRGKPPPVSGDYTTSMIMNARKDARSRNESGAFNDIREDERACYDVPIGNTNVMQQECAKLSNRSVPNPLVDRLFAVRSIYSE